ncbi:MAG: hypothetical protein KAY24_16610 [Candidatus Eisenbacteria sp.]|nr:hypothetical protein [Candidatus Eisenbacteria bacterium]
MRIKRRALACSGSDTLVVMMQATDLGHFSDIAVVYPTSLGRQRRSRHEAIAFFSVPGIQTETLSSLTQNGNSIQNLFAFEPAEGRTGHGEHPLSGQDPLDCPVGGSGGHPRRDGVPVQSPSFECGHEPGTVRMHPGGAAAAA